ncbi:MAG: hypothetical protein IT168_21445 [Bryobacterales bacterium]|nr:hypothetical protein [Bryobacterales bacterium]
MFSVRLRFFPSLICFSLVCTQAGSGQSVQIPSDATNQSHLHADRVFNIGRSIDDGFEALEAARQCGDGVYVLARLKGTRQIVAFLDSGFRVMRRALLAEKVNSWLECGPDGTFLAGGYRRNGLPAPSNRILQFHGATPTREWYPPHDVMQTIWAPGRLFTIGYDGTVAAFESQGQSSKPLCCGSAPEDPHEKYLSIRLGSNRIIVLGGIAGSGRTLSADGNSIEARWTLKHPLLADAEKAINPAFRSRTLLISGVAPGFTSDYFLANIGSGLRGADGAIVLEADSKGAVTRVFRCELPVFPELKNSNNPAGHMMPTMVWSGSQGQLALISRGGHAVRYQTTRVERSN